MCNYTQSPSSKTSLYRPLLACLAYCFVLRSMLNFAISCICLIVSALFLPFMLTQSTTGIRVKLDGVQGLKPLTISNSEYLVVE